MNSIGSRIGAHDDVLRRAAEWYLKPPTTFETCHPQVLTKAYELADQDWHRCEMIDPNTMIVWNRWVW